MLLRHIFIVHVSVLALALSGCSTELKVARYFDPEKLPTAGAPYSLSFTQYEITVTRRLTACSSKGDPTDPDPAMQQPKPIDLKIGMNVDIKKVEASDPMRNYVIDLESLNSFFKTTSATVTYYDSGAIKSLNASAEDKTGEFVTSVAGTFSKLVGAGVIGPSLLDTEQKAKGCSENTKKSLALIDALGAEIETRTEKIELLTTELSKLNAVLLPAKELSSQATRKKLGELQVQLMDEMTKLAIATKKSEPLLQTLSETKKFKWPDHGEIFANKSGEPAIPNLNRKLYDSWLNDDPKKTYAETDEDARIYNKLAADSAIYLKLKVVDKLGRTKACETKCVDDDHGGFKYRIPAQGQLQVCADALCDTLHKESEVSKISQLGHVYVLPLKSTLFSTKTVSASFAENGTPTSIGITW